MQGPRFAAGRPRGPGPGGARGPPFGHAPRPLMGRPPGARPMMRHPAGKDNQIQCDGFRTTFVVFFYYLFTKLSNYVSFHQVPGALLVWVWEVLQG